MLISFVVPVFNEAESLHELFDRICFEMDKVGEEYEVVFVDDGSDDDSFERMTLVVAQNPNVKAIKFRRNFGKSVALDEGFKVAQGDIIFTMDADLQDDPKEIPRFLAKLKEGYDLVSGWKQQRKDPVFSKNLPSKLFNFMISKFAGLKLHDYNCGFKAYRKALTKRLTLYGDMHRYIPAMAHAMGFKVAEIAVEHHARSYGRSKYGPERFFHGFFDFITVIFLTRYLKRPMHFFGAVGLAFSLVGFGISAYLTVLWFLGEAIGHRPLLSLGVLLIILGIQSICTGLIGEMITHGRHIRGDQDAVECVIKGG